jgi:hypothetical protein
MAHPISTIEQHPSRKLIISKILAGDSLKSIGAEFGLSAQSLSRFKTRVIRPALKSQTRAEGVSIAPQSVADLRQFRSETAAMIPDLTTEDLLRRKIARYPKLLDKAEAAGEFGAWASIDRAESAAIELRGRLRGEFEIAPDAQVQIMVVMPRLERCDPVHDVDTNENTD